MLLYPSMVLLLAHHQMFCCCSLAKSDSQTKNNGSASQNYSIVSVDKLECLMAEISAQSSVSSLQSLYVHLDPRSLLGLTILVAAFLNSSSEYGSYAWYCSKSLGTRVLTAVCDIIMISDKEEC